MIDRRPRPWEVTYNGFSWEQRCAVTPLQNAAIRAGRLKRPTICTVCLDDRSERPQARDYRFLHLEDYRQPLKVYGCCKRCHAAVHARFRDPDRWQALMLRHNREGEWFTLLSLDPASQWQPFDLTYPSGLPWKPPVADPIFDFLTSYANPVEHEARKG